VSRDAHRALLAALADYLGPLEDVSSKTFDWASATFVGMRHEIAFTCAASATLIEALPDIDLPMDGHFVADLVVVSSVCDGLLHRVEMEILTIRES
jgi:hypothetical protein